MSVLLSGWGVVVYGQVDDPVGGMRAANAVYENGRYAEAAQLYEQLVRAGFEEGALYYNLGNAYFQQGELGRAILNYKRAMLLTPRDRDVRANLALARGQRIDRYDEGEGTLLELWSGWTRRWMTVNEMAGLVLGLWCLVMVMVMVYGRLGTEARGWGRWLLLVVVVVWLGGVMSLGNRVYLAEARPAGVVVTGEVAVLSGPGEQYGVAFELHSGAEVAVLEGRGSWVRLALPGDELQGWVPESMVGMVR
ncbi:MAG TPA: tetratricopeptide repeat protein [Anaerolineae bacterium]|nr:tetratricopeptide repeat protein [Anaerolineae bacterium]